MDSTSSNLSRCILLYFYQKYFSRSEFWTILPKLGNNDVTVGGQILKYSKNWPEFRIPHPQISLGAYYCISIISSLADLNFGSFYPNLEIMTSFRGQLMCVLNNLSKFWCQIWIQRSFFYKFAYFQENTRKTTHMRDNFAFSILYGKYRENSTFSRWCAKMTSSPQTLNGHNFGSR